MHRIAAAILACLAIAPGHAADSWVWWEGEAAVEHNFPKDTEFGVSTFRPKAHVLSGEDWLTNAGPMAADEAAPFARWRVTVPEAGSHQLWVRKFWKFGAFQWRFGEGEWRQCPTDPHLADGATIRKHLGANWVFLGTVELPAGEQGFELRLPLKEKENKTAAYDCFVLSRGPFDPRGKLKPGERSGAAMEGYFAFEPGSDGFAESAIDLRRLNERRAGEHGPLRRDPQGRILRGDGETTRLWIAQLGARDMDIVQQRYLARRLAKAGVNMVRVDSGVGADIRAGKGTVDPAKLETLQRLVAVMAEEGIYTYLGHVYWEHEGMLFFDAERQRAWREVAKGILTAVNPHTGKRLAEDPAVGVFEIQNEDSTLFWTFAPANLEKIGKLELVERRYAEFLLRRHGSVEKILAAWGVPAVDKLTAERAPLLHVWDLTAGGLKQKPQQRARASDQLRFLVETQRAFYESTVAWLRSECGLKAMVSCSNWKTADETMLDALERWTYTAGDVLCRNDYFGPVNVRKPQFYAINAGDVYRDRSALHMPWEAPTHLIETAGWPHLVTETNWESPNRYRLEWPYLSAAYGSLQGMDGWCFFAIGGASWESTPGVWSVMTPSIYGQFPALALAYRRGDIRESEPAVEQTMTLDSQVDFAGSAMRKAEGLDELRAKEVPADLARRVVAASDSGVDPLAFLVGKVSRRMGDAPALRTAGLAESIHVADKRVDSLTRELSWDYGTGLVRIDAPRIQGAVGFLQQAGPVATADCVITSGNHYGAVVAVSLDGQPLATAKRILIQAGTEDVPYGWKTKEITVDFPAEKDRPARTESGTEIVDLGGYPLNMRLVDVRLRFKRDLAGASAIVLDPNGHPDGRKAELRAVDGGTELTLPKDALYTIIELGR